MKEDIKKPYDEEDINENARLQQELRQQTKFSEKIQEKSPYKEAYLKYLQNIALKNIDEYSSELSKNCITYTPDIFVDNYTLYIISHTESSRVMTIMIVVLNLEDKSPTPTNLQFVSQGSFGRIYVNKYNEQEQFITKSLLYQHGSYSSNSSRIQNQNLAHNNLNNVILQYCICKLCSILEIGPYIGAYYGFDLIIYKDRVQFSMEVCQHLKDLRSQKEINKLKQNLKLLHYLHIVHGDIKPQNIMWSNRYKKLVFIDFGFAYVLNQAEKPGDMTYTSYFGSYTYSSQEMAHAFHTRSKTYVDLYYNDIHGLKLSIQNQKQQKIKDINQCYINIMRQETNQQVSLSKTQIQSIRQSIYINFFLNLKLKRHIFDINLQEVKNLCEKNTEVDGKKYFISFLCQDTLQLLKQVKTSKNSIKIIKYLMQHFDVPTNDNRIKQILLYHNQKIIKNTQNKNPKFNIFYSRIVQKQGLYQSKTFHSMHESNNYQFPYEYNYSEIVSFVRFFYHQDISLRACFFKSKMQYLLSNNVFVDNKVPENKANAFWLYFSKYIYNAYTTKIQILKIFQIARIFLNISDQKWLGQKDQINRFQVPIKVHLLTQAYKNKYNQQLCKVANSQRLSEYYTFYQQCILKNDVLNAVLQVYNEVYLQIKLLNQQEYNTKKFRLRLNQLEKQKTLSNLYKVQSKLRQRYKKTPKKQTKTLQLYLLSIQIISQQVRNPCLIEYNKRYKLIQKIQNYQITSKCRLVHDTLYYELLECMITKEHHEIMNKFFIYQDSMYNYCLQPKYTLMCYFYVYIFDYIKWLLTSSTQQWQKIKTTMTKISQNVRQFFKQYIIVEQKPQQIFNLLYLMTQYCEFYMNNKMILRQFKQMLIRQVEVFYYEHKNRLTEFQVSVLIRMDLKSQSLSESQKNLNLSLLQLKKIPLQPDIQKDVHNENFQILNCCKKQEQLLYLLKQIRLKYFFQIMSKQQEQFLLKQQINFFQTWKRPSYFPQKQEKVRRINQYELGLYVNMVVSNMCAIWNGQASKLSQTKMSYYIDLLYQYMMANFSFFDVSKHYVLLDVLTIYERFYGRNFQKIFAIIMIFISKIHRNQFISFGVVEIYGSLENMLVSTPQEQISGNMQMFLKKFRQLSSQHGSKFYTQYPELLVFCQLLLGMYQFMAYSQRLLKQVIDMVMQLLRKSSYMYQYCVSSFAKSRFRFKASLIVNKLFKLQLVADPVNRKRIRNLITCMRSQQYPINQKQTQEILKKINKKIPINNLKTALSETYYKIRSKIQHITKNKRQQIMKKPSKIRHLRIQQRFYQLLNENSISMPKYEIVQQVGLLK